MTPRDRGPRSFSTHKRRSLWFRESTSWPHRELHAEAVAAIATASERNGGRHGPTWKSVGPTNVAGRMTSVVAHPRDPHDVLGGAAGGGVWRWNGRWHEASNGLTSLNVGSLAVDAADPKHPVVYCGTGEANLSVDGHPGAGLFKSTDWGATWTKLATPEGRWPDRIPGRIGAIAVDPHDSMRLLIGGVGHRTDAFESSGGLFVSPDSGVTWQLVSDISPAPYWCHSVVFETASSIAFAAVTTRGAQGGIWRCRDGTTWEQLRDGLPPPESIHRTTLAVAPSSAGWIYALCADRSGGVLGVYQSRDGGDSWREIAHGHFRGERYMSYNNTIAVDPDDATHVLCGGVEIHAWNGAIWRQITSWRSRHSRPNLPHADHHALLILGGGLVYDMNDGGMAVSADGGETWEDRSAGLVTTTFYDLDVAPSDDKGRVMGGGTQDNGTLVTTKGADGFRDVTGGDGGWMAFDPARSDRFYSTTQYVRVNLHHDFPTGRREDITPPEDAWVSDRVFLAQLRLEPGRSDAVYLGTLGIWRAERAPEQEVSWDRLVADLDGSVVTALEIAPADAQVLYAGTENGGVFASFDRGVTWSGDLSSRVLPGAMITCIRTHPTTAKQVMVCVGRVDHGHVFRSRDWGRTWEDVSGKPPDGLPNAPFRALAVDPSRPDVVYAGSDAGLFVSEDFGDTWRPFSAGLPNVAITDLVMHQKSRQLFAATYGRGIWSTKLPK